MLSQDLKWRADEREQALVMEGERLTSALHQAEMEARVHVAKAEAGARAAHVEAESAKSELSVSSLQVGCLLLAVVSC